MIQVAIAVAASVLLVASFITFEPADDGRSVTLDTGAKASPVDINSAGAGLPVLPPASTTRSAAASTKSAGTRLQGSGAAPPPASAYTSMMFSAGV